MIGATRLIRSIGHGMCHSSRRVNRLGLDSRRSNLLGATKSEFIRPTSVSLGWKIGMSTSTTTSDKNRKDEEQTTTQERIGQARLLFRQYGPVGIGTYGGIYVGTLGLIYQLVNFNIIGAGDAISLIKSLGLDSVLDISTLNPRMGNFALAWILTKFTEPLRLVLAMSITPAIARYLGWAPPKGETFEEEVTPNKPDETPTKRD